MHAVATALVLLAVSTGVEKPFAIRVIDAATGRGVPLVELRTTNEVRYVTDSSGLAVVPDPELVGQKVYFHVKSHGYEYPKDGFGYRGKALEVVPGTIAELKIERLNIAERLYRVTGGGIYRDTVLAGLDPPLKEPLLNAKVFGCDSIINVVHRGRLFWFWGDTNRPAYPLGNFHITGATSALPGQGGLAPSVGVDFDYFVDDEGFARAMAKMPGDGPTWLSGVTVLPDDSGRERIYAHYVKIRPPMETYRRGFAVYNDETDAFDDLGTFPLDAPLFPDGHPVRHASDGVEYVYFATPYPLVRVRATADDYLHPDRYEGYSPLEPGTRPADRKLDRAEDGTLRYAWKRNTPPLKPTEQEEYLKAGLLKPEEALLALRDVETGRAVRAHGGSVYWNPHRERWVMIFIELFGDPSLLGEGWYAEAADLTGPWVHARKIVTHDKYSFYNPRQHPYFDEEGGRIIYFEGTYTRLFSGNEDPTPRYEYNQVMYRLDLSDPRLNLPVPITWEQLGQPEPPGPSPIAFHALERPGPDTVPAWVSGNVLEVGEPPTDDARPTFYMLPADAEVPGTTALYESDGEDDRPLGRVWLNPLAPRQAPERVGPVEWGRDRTPGTRPE